MHIFMFIAAWMFMLNWFPKFTTTVSTIAAVLVVFKMFYVGE